jgi:hypothetical protein
LGSAAPPETLPGWRWGDGLMSGVLSESLPPPSGPGLAPDIESIKRELVNQRLGVLLSWVNDLDGEGLSAPLRSVRGAIEAARRTDDPSRAVQLVDRTSRLLKRTEQRWAKVRELQKREDELRRMARKVGIDTTLYDRRVATERGSIRQRPLSEALFRSAEASLATSIVALEQAIAGQLPEGTEHSERALVDRAGPTSEPAAAAATGAFLVSYLGRSETRSAQPAARSCPGCGSSMPGSYCVRCRVVWVD